MMMGWEMILSEVGVCEGQSDGGDGGFRLCQIWKMIIIVWLFNKVR